MTRRMNPEAEARWVRTVLRDSAGDPGSPARPAPMGGVEMAGDGSMDGSWRRAWATLELPPAPGAPPAFARRIALAWAAERECAAVPLLAGGWMRAAAAAALFAGLALGTSLSLGNDSTASEDDSWQQTTLSEEYLTALAAPDAALTTPDSAASPGAEEP